MPSLTKIAEGMAAAVETLAAEIDNLQVSSYLLLHPTPPAVDIYPGDPFQDGDGFGAGNNSLFFTVRARTTTADHQGGQGVLYQLLEPDSGVQDALESDQTLGGLVDTLAVTPEGISGFRVYADSGGDGQFLGCEWRVEVKP